MKPAHLARERALRSRNLERPECCENRFHAPLFKKLTVGDETRAFLFDIPKRTPQIKLNFPSKTRSAEK